MQNTLSHLCAFLYIGAFLCTTESKAVDFHAENITESLTEKIESFKFHQDEIAKLERTHVNLLVVLAQDMLGILKGIQEKIYLDLVSHSNCSMPLIPRNGGLVFAYLSGVYYCKPICNQGYDFSFLRRSRLYEECGKHTGYSWTSQYTFGERLAECIESPNAVSGGPTAYFNDDKCQNIVSSARTEQQYIETFLQELKEKHIENEHNDTFDFVVCGN
ncbi:uncharacterized protein LOC121395415 [Xenopus laevis]|uniref:Uncharacterized protein LOC121395415 n=2 Tax=Xenopus laevis TaxID=8355 RepID=A0A1L8FK80_XENLA|nr:uncharacterized protein LOC121395415 [Xenopus laevis]OCT72000.1 hypothetical protein XELAEV_18034980mg [Xenopus laevis]